MVTLRELMDTYPQGGRISQGGLEYELLPAPYATVGGGSAVLRLGSRLYAPPEVDEPSWELVEANPSPRTDAETETEFRALMERNGLGEKK
jgi:hypothetical protein